MNPQVSILINNHNYGRFLGEAIDSALDQAAVSVEVIVVDDGSTDDSADVIAGFGRRIRSVAKPNGGQASAFNAGFAIARAPIVMFLDSDDRFLAEKSQVVLAEFDADPRAEWCFHGLHYVEGTGIRTGRSPRQPSGSVDVRRRMRAGGTGDFVGPPTSALTFRSSLLRRLMPVPEEVRITADNYLKAVALGLAPGRYLDRPLAEQRLHDANAYTNSSSVRKRAATELAIAAAIYREWPELREHALRRGMGAVKAIGRSGDTESVAVHGWFVRQLTHAHRLRLETHRAWWKISDR